MELSIAVAINLPQTIISGLITTTTTFSLVFIVLGLTRLGQAVLSLGLLGGCSQLIVGLRIISKASFLTSMVSPQLMLS